MTKTLVVGATGATGRTVARHLLNRDRDVRVIVRSEERLPQDVRASQRLEVVEAPILELSDADLDRQVFGCDSVVSCLGHNLSFRGLFLPPRRLVTEAVHRLCEAIQRSETGDSVRFILMSSVAIVNRDFGEQASFRDRCVLGALRVLVPMHADNVEAAEYLRVRIGRGHKAVRWVAVRPDALIDAAEVSDYEVHPSPTRGRIFGTGSTSRINVGHFMADLVTDDAVWKAREGSMPVIYNREPAVTDEHR